MAGVQIQGVTKVYKPGTPPASDNIDLEIRDGEFFILLGPSGCGKSTLLRMIAGLERVTDGVIRIGEKAVDGEGYVEPKNRDIAMVFQSYALYPHMSVFDNMAFGLKLRGVKKDLIKTRIEEAAESLGLSPYLARLPKELSGGQRQRVALGRALVREPEVFLLDEPLSNLDAKLRGGMRVELKRLQTSLGTTMIYVTHDQVEAMTLGDRIAVFQAGKLQQVGAPLEIYRRPANRFVAGFLGSPPMNFIPGRLVSGGTIKINSEQSFFLPDALKGELPEEAEVELGVRPEDLLVKKPNHGALKATVEVLEALGDRTDAHVRLVGGDAASLADPDAPHIIARVESGDRIPERGELVGLVPRGDRLLVFDRKTGQVLAASGEEEAQS